MVVKDLGKLIAGWFVICIVLSLGITLWFTATPAAAFNLKVKYPRDQNFGECVIRNCQNQSVYTLPGFSYYEESTTTYWYEGVNEARVCKDHAIQLSIQEKLSDNILPPEIVQGRNDYIAAHSSSNFILGAFLRIFLLIGFIVGIIFIWIEWTERRKGPSG